jgi:hypothetical protein
VVAMLCREPITVLMFRGCAFIYLWGVYIDAWVCVYDFIGGIVLVTWF